MGPHLKYLKKYSFSLIEVFNNTRDELVLILENHPLPAFKTTFERGNHYTLLIRKDGYIPKRLEAYVDIKGCILCFDGVGSIQPGISDVLTESNQMGTFLANIELERLSAKNKPTTVYGGESLVEIIFMENLNSEIIEIGTDGQISGGSTAYQDAFQSSSIKEQSSTSSKAITSVVQSATTSTQPIGQGVSNTKNKTTITGIVSAPPSTNTAESSITRVAATPKVNKSNPDIATAPKSTSESKNVNTNKPATANKPSIESSRVPDYKRTSSSANTILSRGNQGETLVKTNSN